MSEMSRLDELEMRAAHQDRVIGELNEMITAQWKKIDQLQSQFNRLRDEVQTQDQGAGGPEPKPPHY